MRGTVAKRLRRAVYEDRSTKIRTYSETNIQHFVHKIKGEACEVTDKPVGWMDRVVNVMGKFIAWFHTATIQADPWRRAYQDMKRQYMAGLI